MFQISHISCPMLVKGTCSHYEHCHIYEACYSHSRTHIHNFEPKQPFLLDIAMRNHAVLRECGMKDDCIRGHRSSNNPGSKHNALVALKLGNDRVSKNCTPRRLHKPPTNPVRSDAIALPSIVIQRPNETSLGN